MSKYYGQRMSYPQNVDWDRSGSDYHLQNSRGTTDRVGEPFHRQYYDYDSRPSHERSQAYDYDSRTERDMSGQSPALRSCFAGNRHRLDEPREDLQDSDRPRQRYAETFKPRRRSPSPIRESRHSYLDNDYQEDDYRRSSRRHKPDRRSGSRRPIAFEEHRSDDYRYVHRYSPPHADDLYDDTPSGRRSSRQESYDRRYDDEDDYRRRRR